MTQKLQFFLGPLLTHYIKVTGGTNQLLVREQPIVCPRRSRQQQHPFTHTYKRAHPITCVKCVTVVWLMLQMQFPCFSFTPPWAAGPGVARVRCPGGYNSWHNAMWSIYISVCLPPPPPRRIQLYPGDVTTRQDHSRTNSGHARPIPESIIQTLIESKYRSLVVRSTFA